MKKIILPIILFILLIPFMVKAENCSPDKISISSITIEDKSDNVEELEEVATNGKNIKYNLSMSNVGDNIIYKVTVKNDSDEDYEIDNNLFNTGSKFINYSIESDNNSNVIKRNSIKTIYLKIEYSKEISNLELNEGKFSEENNFALNISNSRASNTFDTINNPKTKRITYIIWIIVLLFLGVALYFLLNQKKHKQLLLLVIGLSIIISPSVYALCNYRIDVESKITIEKKYSVNYLNTRYGYYTDLEIEKYEKTSDSECQIIYIGEAKYNMCSYIIIKDEKEYRKGEEANLQEIKIRDFTTMHYDPTSNKWENYCETQDDGIIRCEQVPESFYDINMWDYANYNDRYGFDYHEDDKNIMNFQNLNYDMWDNYGYFGVIAPQKFIMPGHNILFIRQEGDTN